MVRFKPLRTLIVSTVLTMPLVWDLLPRSSWRLPRWCNSDRGCILPRRLARS